MGALAESNFLQALGWAVLNSLWQMAFLWVAYQFLSGTFVKRASSRNLLATIMLIGGFTWFVFGFISLLQFDQLASFPGLSPLLVSEDVNDWFYMALPVASVIYLAFLILPCIHFIRNYRYVQVIRTQGLHRAGAEWRLFVNKVSARMAIRKNVQIWLSDFVSSPVTIGYLKPIILLPVAALNNLNPAQIEAILLHELAHIRRFDYLINLSVKLIQAILYFNPFVKAFSKIIEIEREKTCDQMVMQFAYEPHDYASALLALERESRQLQLLTIPAFSGRKSELLIRVESIMGASPKESVSLAKFTGVLAGLTCSFVFVLVVMLSHPLQGKSFSGKIAGYFSPYLVYPATGPVSFEGPELKSSIVNQPLNIATAAGSGRRVSTAPAVAGVPEEEDLVSGDDQSLVFASAVEQAEVVLDSDQTEQVKLAIETSRKVLGEIKWKDMDQSIAEAMTSAQKEIAKQALQQRLEQVNWSQMENKLKNSYDRIDWQEINKNLSNAMIQIKYDSVHLVYQKALDGLAELQVQLDQKGMKEIPDTDITVNAIKQKQAELKKASIRIEKMKARKIIQL